jgi:hypothetical protein
MEEYRRIFTDFDSERYMYEMQHAEEINHSMESEE